MPILRARPQCLLPDPLQTGGCAFMPGACATASRRASGSSTRRSPASSTSSRSRSTRGRSRGTATTSTVRHLPWARCSSAAPSRTASPQASSGSRGSIPTTGTSTRSSTAGCCAARTRRSGTACVGVDGVTRLIQDRARPLRRADGSVLVRGILSDVTRREEADARLAEASDRFEGLLDVVGEHVYLAQVLPDGGVQELFQGPGADRLLGGAEPDPEMENWEAALHPADRPAYDAFNAALAAGEDADVEYRLNGADGITRWVHDRAAARRLPDGTIEISGIVSDVSERRRMRAELADAHAALSRVVEADGRSSLHAAARGRRRLQQHLPRPTSRLTGRRSAPGRHRGRPCMGVARAPRRPAATAGGRRAPGRCAAGRARVPARRPRRRRAHRARPPAPAPRGGRDVYYDGATRDVTERRRLEAELRLARGEAESLARTDELTGTFNRRHFAEIVAEALASDPDGCGLLLLDADHFKQVNDVHGHVVGDAVLVELASRLRAELGPDGLPRAVGRRGVRGAVARRRVGRASSTAARSGCGPPSRCGRSTPRA